MEQGKPGKKGEQGGDDEKTLTSPFQWSQVANCGTKEPVMQVQVGPKT